MSPLRTQSPRSLAFWMATSVGVFVLACSFALLLVFNQRVAREETSEFEALARANAAFLDRTPLPHSDKMAAQLGEVMGAQVVFAQDGLIVTKPGGTGTTDFLSAPADGSVRWLAGHQMVVGHHLRRGSTVYFVRQAGESGGSPGGSVLGRGETWLMLGIVWLLSSGLAWWLARRVARPLQSLAAAVHDVGGDQPLPELPLDRTDEIGMLARALSEAHASLLEERERRRTAERLALLGRMATGMAHEVRNPVAAIRMHAQLLEGAPPEEASASAQLIDSEAARIETLVGQWMHYARPAPPAVAPFNPLDLMLQVMQTLEPQATHAGVKLAMHNRTESVPVILGDRSRLQQVLMNVVLNALQAMPGGGSCSLVLETAGESVTLAVEDEGRGFSPEALTRLGEPFFSEKEGGMGLGLAAAMEICRAHGGHLQATNRSTGGARVSIQLPLSSKIVPPAPA